MTPLAQKRIEHFKKCARESNQRPNGPCVRCGGTPPAFKRHDQWERCFRIIIECFVYTFSVCLWRWKCPTCHKTFTVLPSFAAPYKRYVTETIVEKSEPYPHDPQLSTRKAVLHEGGPIGYIETEAGVIDERQFAHSTLWRWTQWLGGFQQVLAEATSLIEQHAPQDPFFRQILPIPSVKYRSTERKATLESASLFLRAHRFFVKAFARPLFPRFATSPG